MSRTQNQIPNLGNHPPRNQHGNWIGIVLMIMMMMGMINKSNTLAACDFANTKLGTIYALMDIEECQEIYPTTIQTTDKVPYTVFQEAEIYRTEMRECRVKRAVFKYFRGMSSYAEVLELLAYQELSR